MMGIRVARALSVVALTIGLVVISPAAQARPSDDGMSQTQAGQWYLKAVCPEKAAAATFTTQVWHGRPTITFTEVRGRLAELRRLSKAYGSVLEVEARRLYNPPASWPSSVVKQVNKLATVIARESTYRTGQGYATTGAQWSNLNTRANGLSTGALPAIIRARLGLPGPGKGC